MSLPSLSIITRPGQRGAAPARPQPGLAPRAPRRAPRRRPGAGGAGAAPGQRGELQGDHRRARAADYLVSKGMPFRECHTVIGEIVLYCIEHGKSIEQLSLEQLRDFAPEFEADIRDERFKRFLSPRH